MHVVCAHMLWHVRKINSFPKAPAYQIVSIYMKSSPVNSVQVCGWI